MNSKTAGIIFLFVCLLIALFIGQWIHLGGSSIYEGYGGKNNVRTQAPARGPALAPARTSAPVRAPAPAPARTRAPVRTQAPARTRAPVRTQAPARNHGPAHHPKRHHESENNRR